MVFEDLSHDENKTIRQYLRLATVSDRLLAFIFDIIFLTPVVGLMMSSMYKKIQLMTYINPDGLDLNITLLVASIFVFLLVSLLQTFFLLLWQATPGQIFFKIKVVSVDQHLSKMRLTQILLRSFVFSAQFLFFAIPFLVVLGDKHRRGLHDRIAGTLVLTLKKVGDPGPTPFEIAFVHKALLLTSISAIMMVSLSVSHFYQSVEKDLQMVTEKETDKTECAINNSDYVEQDGDSAVIRKVDQAIARYLAQELSSKCLQKTVKNSFFSEDPQVLNWAYFAKWIESIKSIQNDSHISEKYLEKICDQEKSLAKSEDFDLCQLAKASYTFLSSRQNKENRQVASDEHENEYWKEQDSSSFESIAMLSMLRDQKYGHLKSYQEKLNRWAIKQSHNKDFKNYIAENLTKSFWMSGEFEKSVGAYQATRYLLSSDKQQNLDAWLCYEQSFQAEADNNKCFHSPACQNLQENLKDESYLTSSLASRTESENSRLDLNLAIIALAKRAVCGGAALDPIELDKIQNLSEDPSLNVVIRSVLKNKETTNADFDLSELKKVAAYKNRDFMRVYALNELAQKVKTEQDFLFVLEQLKQATWQDYNWQKIYVYLLKKSLQKNDHHQMGLLLGLTPEHVNADLQKQMVIAFYQLKKYDKAWFLASAIKQSAVDGKQRSPASVQAQSADLNSSFEPIYESLKKRFRP